METANVRYCLAMFFIWVGVFIGYLVDLYGDESAAQMNMLVFAGNVLSRAIDTAVLTGLFVAIPVRLAMNLIPKSRRRAYRWETILLVLIPIAIVAYLLEVQREHRELAPPEGVDTLQAFVERMPPPRWVVVVVVESDDRELLAWYGKTSGPLDLASGPSCYLFDLNGRLLDWQPETGGKGPVDIILRSSIPELELSVGDALKMVRKNTDGD